MDANLPKQTIVVGDDATPTARFAAAELRRYVYVRTGVLLDITAERDASARFAFLRDASLAPEAYRLKTHSDCLEISAASDQGLLYGAYAVAEKFGVRFYLHGDVIPDQRSPFSVPDADETAQPHFRTRGILPFHDFPEGPDWWNEDDYSAYIGQLAKMRMNFIGLHTYPEGGVGPEPLVWIGLPEDVRPEGAVASSYPTFWHNTARAGTWGYSSMKSSDFSCGAAVLFPADDYGPDVMDGLMPRPSTPRDWNELFRRVGLQMGRVFANARRLGVQTCIGTETPLTIPTELKQHIAASGRDPADPIVVKELYRGMFERIAAVMPADYYWLWTPEHWTWKNNTVEEFEHTLRDINAAYAALKETNTPMKLATSGWVLGPVHDRSALDSALPKDVPMSAIFCGVGHEAIDSAYARVSGRSTWAIPWMENDPNMIGYQPWAGRMRFDAVDARRHGCDGLIGIHWRTQILTANVAALAAAAWDQSWLPAGESVERVTYPEQKNEYGRSHTIRRPVTGAGSNAASEVYKTCLHDLDRLPVDLPNGTYDVTLQFCEHDGLSAEPRVFDVSLQGERVIEKLNIRERVGVNAACDVEAKQVRVTDRVLLIAFTREAGEPLLCGLVICGRSDAVNQIASEAVERRYNLGGGQAPGYENLLPGQIRNPATNARTMPIESFYIDFARAHFGDTVADAAGRLLVERDGSGSEPDPSTWLQGPGGIPMGHEHAKTAARKRESLNAFVALREHITSPGDLARFDYWAHTLAFSVTLHDVAAKRQALKDAVEASNNDASRAREALSIRVELARLWERLMTELIATVNTPGELGTIANVEQHSRIKLQALSWLDPDLEKALGTPLPDEVQPSTEYAGPARIIVPTVRTSVTRGEMLNLRIFALDRKRARRVSLRMRPLGRGDWACIEAAHIARAVWQAALPAASEDFEYCVEVAFDNGATMTWPASAGTVGQSVIVWPE